MRIWTFGCSFTEYCWPTWADIIIHHGETMGARGYNLGRCGAGNQYIASRIWECNARYKFTKDDWVFICWSGMNREDRYLDQTGWKTLGNINLAVYNEDFVRNIVSEKHFAMRDCMLISSTINGLKNLGVNVVHWTMNPYQQLIDGYAFRTAKNIIEIIDTYNIKFDIPSLMEIIGTLDQSPAAGKKRIPVTWDGENIIPEWHPTPKEHMHIVQDHITKHVSWLQPNLNDKTKDFCLHWIDKIDNMCKPIKLNNQNTDWVDRRTINVWN